VFLGNWLPLVLAAMLASSVWIAAPRQTAQSSSTSHELGGRASEIAEAASPPLLEDVETAFARIPTDGEHLTACVNGSIAKPLYRASLSNHFFGVRNHFQGIQRLADTGYLAISGSNRHGSDLFIVRLGRQHDPEHCTADGRIAARITVDPVMGHAGGLSMLGSILAIPVHGGTPREARVVFYDLADPEHPRRLSVEIVRPGRKASATAVTRLPNGHLLAAVLSAYDGLPLRLDFYLSRSTELDDGFSPDPLTWRVSLVEARPNQHPTFSHFQAINFINQVDGRLYLVGFHNSMGPQVIMAGRDSAELYEVVFPSDVINGVHPVLAAPAVIKVANRVIRCTDGFCNFGAAAGLYVDPASREMSIYATPGWLERDMLEITRFASSNGRNTSPAP
jgi:hypothetical protein